MRKFEHYWSSKKEWTTFKNHILVVADDAPEEAKKSYELYQKQLEEYLAEKRAKKTKW